MLRSVLAVGLALFVVFSVEANSRPSLDEMWELIQKQQVEIDSLKKGLSENDGDIKMEDDVKKTINPARRNIGLAGILSELKSSGQLEDKGPRWSGRANDLKDFYLSHSL